VPEDRSDRAANRHSFIRPIFWSARPVVQKTSEKLVTKTLIVQRENQKYVPSVIHFGRRGDYAFDRRQPKIRFDIGEQELCLLIGEPELFPITRYNGIVPIGQYRLERRRRVWQASNRG
jgi:hypothetical protein